MDTTRSDDYSYNQDVQHHALLPFDVESVCVPDNIIVCKNI